MHTELDHGLSPAARAALEAGVPASTRRAYAADWRSFTAWCAQAGRVALPATSQTVTEYAAHLMSSPSAKTGRPLSPSSVERALTAIRSMHKAASLPAPETSGARKVLAGQGEPLAVHDALAEGVLNQKRCKARLERSICGCFGTDLTSRSRPPPRKATTRRRSAAPSSQATEGAT